MSHSKDNAIGRKQTVVFLIETWGKPQMKIMHIHPCTGYVDENGDRVVPY
jgi:hypothetical protein